MIRVWLERIKGFRKICNRSNSWRLTMAPSLMVLERAAFKCTPDFRQLGTISGSICCVGSFLV